MIERSHCSGHRAERHAPGRTGCAWAALALMLLTVACGEPETGSTPPATVAQTVHETDLNTITLTPEAEARLGIETAPAEIREIEQVRVLGGEVVVPFEREITVTAPVPGTVMGPPGQAIPATGALVRRGTVILRLAFLPSSSDLSQAREQVDIAESNAETARREAARADSLVREAIITAREHELARAARISAEAELRAARSRLALLDGATAADSASLAAMPVVAPRDGVLWEVHVSQGQTVAASALLFEVIDLDPAWIRVPVYVGDVPTLARDRTARVRKLGASPVDRGVPGRPIAAPPSADPLAASAHVYYEVRNIDRAFRPHERVEVAIPRRDLDRGLVVPWAAIVFDVQGGSWVYEQVQPHVYARRRVEIRSVSGDHALLVRGPTPGAAVVTTGAAELFGTEFGTGK